jgi:pre-mRNA-splicing factor ISY1
MALKEEKAQSMFNKWWSMRRALHVRDPDEPPPVIEDCNSLKECGRWRQTVMKDIGDKVAEIQNAGLGDFKIRALNDEINKLLNHKRLWEKRIRELGGPDYTKNEIRFLGMDGSELPGSGGYLYFGAAKDLPGVRELFYERPPAAPEKRRPGASGELDENYYGGSDVPVEVLRKTGEWETTQRREAVRRWAHENSQHLSRVYPNWRNLSDDQLITTIRDWLASLPAQAKNEEQSRLSYAQALEEKRRVLLATYFPEARAPELGGEGDYLNVEEFEAINE